MAGRPEVEITDAVRIALDVTDGAYRQPNIYAKGAKDIYAYAHFKDDSGVNNLYMCRSFDGGATWFLTSLEDTAGTTMMDPLVWHESWTPTTAGTGFATGTKLWQAWMGNNGGDAAFTYIDVASDTWKTGNDHGLVHETTNMTNLLRYQGKTVRPNFFQTSDGEWHFVACDNNVVTGPMHWRSTADPGNSWSYVPDSSTSPFPDAIDDDGVAAIPIGDNKIMFLWWDIGTDTLHYRVWDNDDDTWGQSVTQFASGYEGAALTGGVQFEPWSMLWIPDDAFGDERVVLAVTVNATAEATGYDIDFWEYDVATDTWTQQTNVTDYVTDETYGAPALTYVTDTGRIYCAYFRADQAGGLYGLYSRYTDNGGTSWSSETDHNATSDHLAGLRTNPYTERDDGTFTAFYGNDDTNRFYVTNLDIFYPIPITTDFSADLYYGTLADWTQYTNGPGAKGLEVFGGGIGFKWQDGDISPYEVGMYRSLPSAIDISGKILLFEIESFSTAAIKTKANDGLFVRFTDGDTDWAEYRLAGSDTLAGGAETLLLAGDATPVRSSGTFDKTNVTDIRFVSTVAVVDYKDDPPWVFKSLTTGSYIRVRGGTSGNKLEYEDIRQWSEFYGLGLIQRSGNFFQIFAKLFFGDDTSEYDTYFLDTNKIVNFPPSGIGDDFLTISIEGTSSKTTSVQHGQSIGSGSSTVGYGGCVFDSAPDRFGSQDKVSIKVLDDDVDLAAFYGCKFLEGKTVEFGNATYPLSNIDLRIVDCSFDTNDEVVRRVTSSALLWLRNQIVGESTSGIGLTLRDTTIVDLDNLSVYGSYDGIKLTQTGDIDFDYVYFGSNTTDVFNDSGGHVNIYVTGGTTPTTRNGTSATTTVSVNPVTTLITVKTTTGTVVENARVFLWADTGGSYPSGASVSSIVRSDTTATVTMGAAHNLTTGDQIFIDGANENEYNGVYTVTVTGATTFTYTVSGSPDSPATGTITATWVLFEGDLTNASGQVSDVRSFSADQPIHGRVRKSTTSPYYKTANFSGTIDYQTGLTVNVQLVNDE